MNLHTAILSFVMLAAFFAINLTARTLWRNRQRIIDALLIGEGED